MLTKVENGITVVMTDAEEAEMRAIWAQNEKDMLAQINLKIYQNALPSNEEKLNACYAALKRLNAPELASCIQKELDAEKLKP